MLFTHYHQPFPPTHLCHPSQQLSLSLLVTYLANNGYHCPLSPIVTHCGIVGTFFYSTNFFFTDGYLRVGTTGARDMDTSQVSGKFFFFLFSYFTYILFSFNYVTTNTNTTTTTTTIHQPPQNGMKKAQTTVLYYCLGFR